MRNSVFFYEFLLLFFLLTTVGGCCASETLQRASELGEYGLFEVGDLRGENDRRWFFSMNIFQCVRKGGVFSYRSGTKKSKMNHTSGKNMTALRGVCNFEIHKNQSYKNY